MVLNLPMVLTCIRILAIPLVVLVYYLDLPLADAAQALGIPLGTAKSRLNRATSALRAVIEADGREPSPVREQIA